MARRNQLEPEQGEEVPRPVRPIIAPWDTETRRPAKVAVLALAVLGLVGCPNRPIRPPVPPHPPTRPRLLIAPYCLTKPVVLSDCDLLADPPKCKTTRITYTKGCEKVDVAR